jgi:hypothetical protein
MTARWWNFAILGERSKYWNLLAAAEISNVREIRGTTGTSACGSAEGAPRRLFMHGLKPVPSTQKQMQSGRIRLGHALTHVPPIKEQMRSFMHPAEARALLAGANAFRAGYAC